MVTKKDGSTMMYMGWCAARSTCMEGIWPWVLAWGEGSHGGGGPRETRPGEGLCTVGSRSSSERYAELGAATMRVMDAMVKMVEAEGFAHGWEAATEVRG